MRRRSPVIFCLIGLIVLAASLSCAETLEDKVKEFTLENGMKFLVIERHEAPVFFGAIAFRVGSIYEGPGITGISHLLEHMLFKGTETIGTVDYDAEIEYLEKEDRLFEATTRIRHELMPWRLEYLEDYATKAVAGFTEDEREKVGTDKVMELGLLIDKMRADGPPDSLKTVPTLLRDGDTDCFELFIDLKGNERALFETTAEHRELIVSNELWETYLANGARFLNAGTSNDGTYYFAYLPASRLELWMLVESDRMANPVFREFYAEREVVMEERRMSENEPEDVLYESFMAAAYSASQYGVPVLGWMSELLFMTRGQVEEYYRTKYAPNNCIAVLVGDLDFGRVKRMAERYFGDVPPGEPLPILTTREPRQQGERRVIVKKDAKPTLMIGYHVPTWPHPDSYVLDVLLEILGVGRTSRLYKGIYEERELTRGAPEVWMGPGSRLDPLFTIAADPREPHTLEQVELAIYEELERLKTETVEMRQLERAWNRSDAQLVRSLGSNVGLAFTVGMFEIMRGDWRELLIDMEMKRKVTPDDIMRVAKLYFTEENRTVGWLVETVEEGKEREEEIDFAALMAWVQTLPDEEQREHMMRFQSLDDKGKEAFARELHARMKGEKGP